MLLQKVNYAYIIAQTPDGPSTGAAAGHCAGVANPYPSLHPA
jgi:hypothetical protein